MKGHIFNHLHPPLSIKEQLPIMNSIIQNLNCAWFDEYLPLKKAIIKVNP